MVTFGAVWVHVPFPSWLITGPQPLPAQGATKRVSWAKASRTWAWHDRFVRKVLLVLGFVVGLYFVVRAVVEPFVIDPNDPSTYELDWGGPSLAGVLLVHCGPGLVAAGLMIWWSVRRTRARAE